MRMLSAASDDAVLREAAVLQKLMTFWSADVRCPDDNDTKFCDPHDVTMTTL